MLISLTILLATLSSIFRSHRPPAGEPGSAPPNRRASEVPKKTLEIELWIYLSHLWRDWRSALAIVDPVTVVAWHRASFRLFWTRKVRRCHRGRPILLREARDLIHKMCRKNLGWRAPRLHGELLKLGIDIGESGEGYEPLRNSQKAIRAVA